MIVELGHFALLLAFGVAVLLGTLPLWGAHTGNARWLALARPAAAAQLLLVALAFAALVQAFVRHDFSVDYVAAHSNRLLPLGYRVAAVWGGHEGSLLLWALMLAGWTAAVAAFSRALPTPLVARVLAVLGLISVGFLAFILFTSNPFTRLLPAALEGRDLNPLLQDIGMVAHPPLLYMGYVGFAVAYAFAVAALIEGRLDARWTQWARPWTLAAWSFLTAGILLGSFWAYYELGWGGWWFWDAVENAAFMPWLVGTALLHSLAVTTQRGGFARWTLLLALLGFSLSLLGTFLVRSGVVSSVHAFASDPQRGVFILALLALAIGGALTLYGLRAPVLGPALRFKWLSREGLLLLNNVLLVVTCGTVLLGTLYPLALESLGGATLSVGAPYFDAVFVPLMLPLLALLGVGPYLRWREHGGRAVARELRLALLVALALAAVATLAWRQSVGFALGMAVGWWVVLSTVQLAWRRVAAQGLGRVPAGTWGMLLAHLGAGVFALAVTSVRSLESAQDISLKPGQSVALQALPGTTLELASVQSVSGPNYRSLQATLHWQRGSQRLATLQPEKRLYTVRQIAMTEAAIDRRTAQDLYLSLGEPTADGRWVLRVQVKPFMSWVWIGALLIALGGGVAALDRRYRQPRKQSAQRKVAGPHTAPQPEVALYLS